MVKLQITGKWTPLLPASPSRITGNPSVRLLPENHRDGRLPVCLILDSRKAPVGKKSSSFIVAKPFPAYSDVTDEPTFQSAAVNGRYLFEDGNDYQYISSLYPAGKNQFKFDYDGEDYILTSTRDEMGEPIYVISKA